MTKEWNLAALKKLYPHLDLDAEFCDATAWCMLHNRSLTNAFFLNWITKCDEKFAGTITFQPIKKEKWPAPAANASALGGSESFGFCTRTSATLDLFS
jgi:hypothetical protein